MTNSENNPIEINVTTKSGDNGNSSIWWDLVKLLAPLLLGTLFGAVITGTYQVKVEHEKWSGQLAYEKERRQTEIILRVFEVSKYATNQKDSGKLDADAFAGNIELLTLGNFFKTDSPDVEAIKKKAYEILDRTWTKAAQYEALGLQALLTDNLKDAKNYFTISQKAYPDYHSVSDIKTLLETEKLNLKQVKCIIAYYDTTDLTYSYKLPSELLNTLKTQAGSEDDCKAKVPKDYQIGFNN
jgi:hypothetical protein